jgi:hypothetical protein
MGWLGWLAAPEQPSKADGRRPLPTAPSFRLSPGDLPADHAGQARHCSLARRSARRSNGATQSETALPRERARMIMTKAGLTTAPMLLEVAWNSDHDPLMKLQTLGGITSFAVQIAAGAAVVLWPEARWIAWIIFGLSMAGWVICLAWWAAANYEVVRRLKDNVVTFGAAKPARTDVVRATHSDRLETLFRRREIHISEFVGPDNEPLKDKVFEDCVIRGPAIIILGEHASFDTCDFQAPEGSQSLADVLYPIEFNDPDRQSFGFGMVAALGCRFLRCEFRHVGFAAPPPTVEMMKKQVPPGQRRRL